MIFVRVTLQCNCGRFVVVRAPLTTDGRIEPRLALREGAPAWKIFVVEGRASALCPEHAK